MNVTTVNNIITIVILLILAVQAYSDYKSMLLYYWLSIIGIIIGLIPCISVNHEDMLYIGICILFILMQYEMKAFTFGDAKLCLIALEVIIPRTEGIGILIRYLLFSAISLAIILIFVLITRIINRMTKTTDKKKKYAYAPSVFFATICSLLY